MTAAYATTATNTSGVGAYSITATLSGASLGNYTPTINSGTLTVTKAPLTIAVNNATRAYGAANPTLTGTITGVLFTDTVTATYSTIAVATSAPGSYPITAVLGGASAGNYSATITPGTLTVTTATLTVTVNSLSKIYGSANPTFTGTVSGLLNGDTVTTTYSTTAAQFSTVGSYPITAQVIGAAVSNYTLAVVPGTLTVSQAILSVTVNNASRLYGAAKPNLHRHRGLHPEQ